MHFLLFQITFHLARMYTHTLTHSHTVVCTHLSPSPTPPTALVFGSVLLRHSHSVFGNKAASDADSTSADVAKRKARFIYHLLVEDA